MAVMVTERARSALNIEHHLKIKIPKRNEGQKIQKMTTKNKIAKHSPIRIAPPRRASHNQERNTHTLFQIEEFHNQKST